MNPSAAAAARRRDRAQNKLRTAFFWIGVGVVQTIAILIVTPLMIAWVAAEMSRVSNSTNAAGLEAVWSGGPATFNWHPLLMTLGFVLVQTQALLTYRFYSRTVKQLTRKSRLKYLHIGFHVLTFLLMSIGLAAAFAGHESGTRFNGHLTSLHSWLGLMTVVSFMAQFTFGALVYLHPTLTNEKQRRISLHYHRLLGLSLYGLACATIISGAVGLIDNDRAKYPDDVEAGVGQFSVLFIPVLVVTVVFLLTKSDYRRRRDPEETPLGVKGIAYSTENGIGIGTESQPLAPRGQ